MTKKSSYYKVSESSNPGSYDILMSQEQNWTNRGNSSYKPLQSDVDLSDIKRLHSQLQRFLAPACNVTGESSDYKSPFVLSKGEVKGLRLGAAKDAAKTILTKISYNHARNEIASTDGYKLVVMSFPVDQKLYDFDLFLDPDSVTNRKLHVSELKSIHLDGKFPDYTRIIPKHGEVKEFTVTDAMLKQLKAWAKSKGNYTNMVRISEGTMSYQIDGKDGAESTIETAQSDIVMGGDVCTRIGFNLNYLLDSLEFFGAGAKVKLTHNSEVQPFLMELATAEPGCERKVMLMPIKP